MAKDITKEDIVDELYNNLLDYKDKNYRDLLDDLETEEIINKEQKEKAYKFLGLSFN